MSASPAERTQACAADEKATNILPHKLLGLPPRKSRARESRRAGGAVSNTVEEGLEVKGARGQTTNRKSEMEGKEAARRNKNNPHHKNAQPKTLEEILSTRSGAGRNRTQLHQNQQESVATGTGTGSVVRVDDLLLAIGVSPPPAFDSSDCDYEQIDRDEDGDDSDIHNHHGLASSSSRRPSAATAEGDGSSATSSRSTTPGATTEHQHHRHHSQRTAVTPLNAEAIWQLRRESESVNIVSGAKRHHQGSALSQPQGARKDTVKKRGLGIIDSFRKDKGERVSAFLSPSQPQSSSGSFLAATSSTHSKPAEGAPPSSWRCDKCHYHLLAMDGNGNPLPFGKDAWGRPIPMACPRCLEKHLEWSPTPVFDSYGDHANIIAKSSDVIRYGAPRVIPPSESVFNLFLRRGAAASATAFGRGLMAAATATSEVNTGNNTLPVHQINNNTTSNEHDGEDADESLFSDSQQLRGVLGSSAITRALSEIGGGVEGKDDHSSSLAKKGASKTLGTSPSPTPLQLAKTLPLPFTSVRDARVYQLTLGRPHPLSARYFEKDSLVAAKRALLCSGGDGMTKSDKKSMGDREGEGDDEGEEEEEEEVDDFEALGGIEDQGDTYSEEENGASRQKKKKRKKPRARHSIYAPLPGPLQGLANLTRLSDGEGGFHIALQRQHYPMSTTRTVLNASTSSSSGARLRMLYYNAFRAEEGEEAEVKAKGTASSLDRGDTKDAVDNDMTPATGSTPSPPLRSALNSGANNGGFVPQPPTPQQQRSFFASSSSQDAGKGGGENSFFVGVTFSSGLAVPPPMVLAEAPAAYLARQGGPSPFSPTSSLFQPRSSRTDNGVQPIGGLLGTLLELELDQPQMPLVGGTTTNKGAASRTQSVLSSHTSTHTSSGSSPPPATVPGQKGAGTSSSGGISGRRGVVSVGEPSVVIVAPSSVRTCCADENPMDVNVNTDQGEKDTLGNEEGEAPREGTTNEGRDSNENTTVAPTMSTSNSSSVSAASSNYGSRASTLSSRKVNAAVIPSPPPAAPMAGSAARGSILANSTAELLDQNAAQRQQLSAKGQRGRQSSAAAAGTADCVEVRDTRGVPSTTMVPRKSNGGAYYKGLATLASERMMMNDPLGLGLADPSSLSAPTVEAAELERLRGRKWTFQCARCGRRLHRMDPFGFLIPLGKDREGNVIPLKCAGCEGSEPHTDFIIVPLARVIQMEEAGEKEKEKEKEDTLKPRHAPIKEDSRASPLLAANKAVKGKADAGNNRGASVMAGDDGFGSLPKAIPRPAVKRVGGGGRGAARKEEEEKKDAVPSLSPSSPLRQDEAGLHNSPSFAPYTATHQRKGLLGVEEVEVPLFRKEEEQEHPSARGEELNKDHDVNSSRNPTCGNHIQRSQAEGGRERERRVVPVATVLSDSFSALSPSQSLPEGRRMTLLTPNSNAGTHYSSRNSSPRPSLSSVPLNNGLLDAANKGSATKDAMMMLVGGGTNGARASESSSSTMSNYAQGLGVDGGYSAPRTSSRVRVSILSNPSPDTALRGKVGAGASSSTDPIIARGTSGVTSQSSYAKAMALARLLEEK